MLVGMTVEVIIPWRGGCPHREAALEFTLGWWHELGFEPTIGTAVDDGGWRKADCVNPYVEASTADVIVVADGDCLAVGMREAIGHVEAGRAWAMPFGVVWRLAPHVTTEVLEGQRAWSSTRPPDLCDRPRRGMPGGGLVVARRDVMIEAPMDRRFVGWGGEDHSWGMAMGCLFGRPLRIQSPLVHLWHPPQPRENRTYGSVADKALRLEYRRAMRDQDAMRAVLAAAGG